MQDNTKDLAVAYWQKGKDAISRSDWKSAVEMFRQSVVLAPQSVHTRRALRDAQTKAVGDRAVSKIESAKLLTIRTKIGVFRAQKKWEDVERLAEDGLGINPRDADMNAAVALAWKGLGWAKLTVYGYETALKLDRKNKRILAASAEMYEEQNQVLKAKGLWERLLEIDPGNENARRRIMALEAQGFMEQKEAVQNDRDSRIQDSGPMIEPVHLKPSSPHLDRPKRKPRAQKVKTSAVETLRTTSESKMSNPVVSASERPLQQATPAAEVRIAAAQQQTDPNQMTLLAIADNYILQGKMNEGAAVLRAAFEISGSDPHVGELLRIVEQGRSEQKVCQ